jgi:hypothetical protein
MHYHPMGEAVTDRTRVGLHFASSPVLEITNHWILNHTFEIPPGAANHQVEASYTVPADVEITALIPHMHYRGKDMQMTAVLPSGERRLLIDVPAYDFNWQTVYELKERFLAPAGTRIEVVGHFDNSAQNDANPDSAATVHWGPSSLDEMFIGMFDYVVASAPGSTSGSE